MEVYRKSCEMCPRSFEKYPCQVQEMCLAQQQIHRFLWETKMYPWKMRWSTWAQLNENRSHYQSQWSYGAILYDSSIYWDWTIINSARSWGYHPERCITIAKILLRWQWSIAGCTAGRVAKRDIFGLNHESDKTLFTILYKRCILKSRTIVYAFSRKGVYYG